MKDVKKFATYVAEHLFDEAPEMKGLVNVEIRDIVKNNGMKLTGLIIREKGCNIAPTIYVNDGFNKYRNGKGLDELVAEYLNVYKESKPNDSFSVEFFTDFEQAKENLTMKLISEERNKELLKEVPYYKLGDLAIIFQVRVEANEYGNAFITVKKEHMKSWGTDAIRLFDNAKANMEEKHPVRIQSILEVLRGMMGEMSEEILEGVESKMYVLSNESKLNAASGMIFTEKLQEFAEVHNSNLFIIPSSIHELLLIPDSGDIEVEYLENIVREVNLSEVAPEEILSDNVYYYNRDEKCLMWAKTMEKMELVAS